MCVGTEWVSLYKESIQNFSKSSELHLLTDSKDNFHNCKVYEYGQKEFSYYDKLIFIFKLLVKYKTRVTYIDSDWISKYNTDTKFDTKSIYSYHIYDLNEKNIVTDFFKESEFKIRKEILNYIDFHGKLNYYIPEALISIPYSDKINNAFKDIKLLKKYIESYYNRENTNPRFNKYKKHGIGYGEGWALSAVSLKFNYNILDINWRKKDII